MYDNNFLAKHLRTASTTSNEKVFAYQTDLTPTSYGALFVNAEKIATVLTKGGLNPGDRVAMQVGKSIQAIELYLGTIIAGGVFLPLNTDYTASEVKYFLKDASPTIFVCDTKKYIELKKVAKAVNVKTVLTLNNDGTIGTLLDAMSEVTNRFKAIDRGPEDLAAILYTSGTTGRSKGAMLSHRSLASNSQTLKDYWQFTSDDCLIHALPIFHIHGLFVAINITLTAGSSLKFLPKFDVTEILESMAKATVLMGVPTFYTRLLAQDGLNKSAVNKMRLFVSGSAPMLVDTHNKWQEITGHTILERYGMTETNMNTSNPYHGARKPGTVGLPLPGVDAKITDPESGAELKQGEIGQIEVKGDNVFSGYWNMPEKTAEELGADGWFKTGDIGAFDEDGYVSIVGRSKDLIISGGFNVYPKEIESVIDDLDSVIESAVIGVPHADFGEVVVAVVVLANKGAAIDHSLDKQIIKDHAQKTLARFKLPKKVFFAEELPRNRMGKVQKAMLREQFAQTFKS